MNLLFLSFVSEHWRKFLFPVVALAALIAFLFIPRGQADNNNIVLSEQTPFPELIQEDVEQEVIEEVSAPTIIIVDVKGAVRHPGVYSLEDGDRFIDAVKAAGGYTPDADSRLLNHALRLTDELLIYVPLEGEELPDGALSVDPIPSEAGQANEVTVNINTATESELLMISGIGPSKATAIIQHREEHGPYQTSEGLMDVSGIGQKTFEKLQHQIKVK